MRLPQDHFDPGASRIHCELDHRLALHVTAEEPYRDFPRGELMAVLRYGCYGVKLRAVRKHYMRRTIAVVALLVLASCTHAPPPPMVWVRTDGQRIEGDPALEGQGESDKAFCAGNTHEVSSASRTNPQVDQEAETQSMQDCMFQSGYLLVPVDQAEAVREQHAATSAELRPSVPVTRPVLAAAKPRPGPKPPRPKRKPPRPTIPTEYRPPQAQQPSRVSPQQSLASSPPK